MNLRGGSWDSHIALLSLIQESCMCLKNSYQAAEWGCFYLAPAKVTSRSLPLVSSGKHFWQWVLKSLRFVSLGRKSWQESELYLPVLWKCVLKSERNGTTFKGSEILELWLPGADKLVKTGELPGRDFWIIRYVNEKSTWRIAYLPVGLAWLRVTAFCTNQNGDFGSQERFCSDNTFVLWLFV